MTKTWPPRRKSDNPPHLAELLTSDFGLRIYPENRVGLKAVTPHCGASKDLRPIGSGAGDCAPAPSHTTGRAVFRIRRLDRPEIFRPRPRDRSNPNTPTGWGPAALGLPLVSPGWRPQLSGPAASFVIFSSVQCSGWLRTFLRPLAPPGFHRVSSLLWPLLTSPRLSARRSPWVSAEPVPACRLALRAPSMTLGLRLCSPARPRSPASLPVRVPTVAGLPAALWVSPSRFPPGRSATVGVITPSGTFHPERFGTCQAHERRRPVAGALALQAGHGDEPSPPRSYFHPTRCPTGAGGFFRISDFGLRISRRPGRLSLIHWQRGSRLRAFWVARGTRGWERNCPPRSSTQTLR